MKTAIFWLCISGISFVNKHTNICSILKSDCWDYIMKRLLYYRMQDALVFCILFFYSEQQIIQHKFLLFLTDSFVVYDSI